MTFSSFRLKTHQTVHESMAKLGYPAVPFDVSEPPRKEFGDLTCNVAFLLSKQLKMAPPKIAQELIEKGIKPHLAEQQLPFIKSVEPHPAVPHFFLVPKLEWNERRSPGGSPPQESNYSNEP